MEDKLKEIIWSGKRIRIIGDKLVYYDGLIRQTITNTTRIRYGFVPLEVYHFTIGYILKIELANVVHDSLTISIKTIFGINGNRNYETYMGLINFFWDHIFDGICDGLIDQFNKSVVLSFDGCELNNQGVSIKKGYLLGAKEHFIHFDDMIIQERAEYFSINSKSDPKLFTNVFYIKTWNAITLREFIKSILEKGSDGLPLNC